MQIITPTNMFFFNEDIRNSALVGFAQQIILNGWTVWHRIEFDGFEGDRECWKEVFTKELIGKLAKKIIIYNIRFEIKRTL